jgi:3,4-dihydroxy 2-butanone 4-phosphate synthase/GTP cyclohydrolase II
MSVFSSISDALLDIAQGKMIVVVDDEDRENEGDLVMAAECITPEAVNFMAMHARGLICVSITEEIAEKFKLLPMVQKNSAHHGTAFTISIDASENITTGISAYDRWLTIKLLTQSDTTLDSFVSPGHIFPLIGKKGGVLERPGHTEASIDIAQSAGLQPMGVICEIMNEDGSMARLPELHMFAKKHNLKLINIKDLILYKKNLACHLEHVSEADMPTKYGNFRLHVFEHLSDSSVSLALIKGDLNSKDVVKVRLHSECFTGELLHSLRCDCGDQLTATMKILEDHGNGMIIYLRQEGRGIGLVNKIKSYMLQDNGYDTVEANHILGFKDDMRDYDDARAILKYFNIQEIDLITNNPMKVEKISKLGISVAHRTSLEVDKNKFNKKYLATKKNKMGHLLTD